MVSVSGLVNCLTANCYATAASLGLLIVIFLYWYGTKTRRMLESTFPGIPGPKPWPFLGNMPQFFLQCKGQIHIYLDENYKKYGSLFCTSFQDAPVLVVSDTKMIKEIMVKHFDDFHNRPSLLEMPFPLNTSLDIAAGETWHRIRTILSPSFSSHKLKSMIPLMNSTCGALLEKMDSAAKNGESIDILQCQQGLTLDTILSTAFGVQTDYQRNPDDPVMDKAKKAMQLDAISQALVTILPLLPLGNYILNSKFVMKNIIFRDVFDLMDFTQKVVDMKRSEGSDRKDFLDLMLSTQGPDVVDSKKLSKGEIIMQCVLFLLAGYETSSTTMTMTCYYLASNPDVQEKLQGDIDEIWTDEDKMPSYETVQQMPYLDMVISETLRLCPPGSMLLRECIKDCVIDDLKIPKGCIVASPLYSIHRDPNNYPNPDKFDPERFTAEAKQSRDPYVYLPFGTGPRNCIGMRFAQMEMKLVLTRILKKFTLVTIPETKPPILESKPVLLGPPNGTLLGVKYREDP